MERNLVTDPFATNENEFAVVFAGRKAQVEGGQPAPAQEPDQAIDPQATNPLPEVAAPVTPAAKDSLAGR